MGDGTLPYSGWENKLSFKFFAAVAQTTIGDHIRATGNLVATPFFFHFKVVSSEGW